MTNEKAIEVLQEQIDRYGQEYDAEGIEALEMAIKALNSWAKYSDELWKIAYARGYNDAKTREQQPCEDCISRRALLDNLEKPMNWTDSDAELQEQRDYEGFVELVESMPSVTPKAESEDEE